MSDYWHAVSRAALGLPGSAEPRPRSVFEPDDLAARAIETVDEEVDAQPPRAQPRRPEPAPGDAVQTAQPPAPSREPAPPAPPRAAAPRQAETRVEIHTVRTETIPPQQERAQAVLAPDETRHTETAQPAQTRGDPVPAIERQRIADGDARQPAASAVPAQHEMPARTETVTRADAAAPQPDDARVAARLVEPPDIVAPHAAAAQGESEPLVIEIGRIDIRIASETPPPAVAPRRRDTGVPLSLDDYLAQRSRAGR